MTKDLYVATSLEELDKKFELDLKLKSRNVSQLANSVKTLIEAADKSWIDRDEECAYVHYMKALGIITMIQKKPDFAKERDFVSKILGSNVKLDKIFDRLTTLKDSLKNRYKALNPSENPLPPEPLPLEMQSQEEEVPQVLRETIDCKTLFEMMSNNEKILIMDCRLEECFEQSRPQYQYTLNVPEEIAKIGMSASKIHKHLPNESKVFWQMRDQRTIIICDWTSKMFNRNSAVWHLREILNRFDDIEKKQEILLLEGGYEAWKTHYPMKCKNPHYQRPNDSNGFAQGVDDIEYPTLEDIVMKDDTLNRSSTVPAIDRSMKAGALEAHHKSKLEILEETGMLMEKSLQNEKNLLLLETSLTEIANDKENNDDSANKEQANMFQIWELQSKQRDYDSDISKMKEKLDHSKPTEPLNPQELTRVMQVERDLQEKEQQRKFLQSERERKNKERNEALKYARDHKPTFNDHRTPPKSQRSDELILTPKSLSDQVISPISSRTPLFDRSSKPMHTLLGGVKKLVDHDFDPVPGRVERGLTGLKNLGNTCYMNSIIQCLSNTSTLREFLLENQHEKYVNRSNKTKGHIVRMLAAVIGMLWSGDNKYISSKHLKAAIGEQDNLFYGMDQQDSHEFLIMLIDWLQSDLQTISVHQSMKDNLMPASEKAWHEYTKAKESFILRLFYGQIKSTVKCKECTKESYTYETFSNLSLELPLRHIDRCHIDDCFNLYFDGELIKGWNCPHCKAPRDAIKKLDVSKLPPVLVIHLKRFYADPYATFRKTNTYVDFPLTDLNMLPYVARSEKNNGSNKKHFYKLYAVSNHYGTMESGHYTAFCRNYMQDKWYKFDDHTVSAMDRNDVKSSAAYILFYTAIDDDSIKRRRS